MACWNNYIFTIIYYNIIQKFSSYNRTENSIQQYFYILLGWPVQCYLDTLSYIFSVDYLTIYIVTDERFRSLSIKKTSG